MGWRSLAIIFLFLGFDELLMFHERLNIVMKAFNQSDGPFTYLWWIPAGLCVLVLSCIFVPFLRSLDRPLRSLFLLSGSVYLSGAVGFEVLGAIVSYTNGGMQSLEYLAVATTEELLELLGLSIFIYALIRNLELKHFTVKVNF